MITTMRKQVHTVPDLATCDQGPHRSGSRGAVLRHASGRHRLIVVLQPDYEIAQVKVNCICDQYQHKSETAQK